MTHYCIRVKQEWRDRCNEFASNLPGATDIFVGNPIHVWVTCDLTLEQIEALPGVDVAVVSIDNDH